MSDTQPDPKGLFAGQRIRITAGTFENFEATVEEIDAGTGKVHAGINIFGCVTPIELEPSDCEPINESFP